MRHDPTKENIQHDPAKKIWAMSLLKTIQRNEKREKLKELTFQTKTMLMKLMRKVGSMGIGG